MGMVYKIKFWDIKQEVVGDFHIIGDNFWNAIEIVNNHLDEKIGEDGYEILMVKAKPSLNVVNYNNEEEQPLFIGTGSCPYCTFNDAIPEMRIIITCPKCGEELKLADNSWESVFCRQCFVKIDRINVYKNEIGEWLIKNMDDIKKEI